MSGMLARITNVRREEVAPVLIACLFFFCILTALMVLRPAREALGMRSGLDTVRWLFIGTALVTLAANPIFGWLVSRFRRMSFIAATYVFFAASLLVFYGLLTAAPEATGEVSGRVFYVWFSVFNLFVTMVFWALMADRFSLDQGKRFFGVIAVGGTCGAIFGPWLASVLAEPLGTPALILVAVGFLLLAIGAAWVMTRLQPKQGSPVAKDDLDAPPAIPPNAIIGGSAWEGFRAVFTSRYLMGIAAFVVILAIISTFLYFTRLAMVAGLGEDLDMRTRVFAQIDLVTQTATLVLQLLVAGHIMKRLGVHVALILLPVTVFFGFIGLAIIGSLAALVIFEAAFRAVQRAIMRPARETLYTVVSREDKYKAKAFIDTFLYRGGDVMGAWTEGLLGKLGLALVGLASLAVPIAVVWGALAMWLARTQAHKAREQEVPRGVETAPEFL